MPSLMDLLLCKYMNIDDDLDHLEWLWPTMGQEGRLVPEDLNNELSRPGFKLGFDYHQRND